MATSATRATTRWAVRISRALARPGGRELKEAASGERAFGETAVVGD
jgi:hypothetical protein